MSTLSTLHDWNAHQVRVFRRYCRLYGVRSTPDLITPLARRFAAEHARRAPGAGQVSR